MIKKLTIALSLVFSGSVFATNNIETLLDKTSKEIDFKNNTKYFFSYNQSPKDMQKVWIDFLYNGINLTSGKLDNNPLMFNMSVSKAKKNDEEKSGCFVSVNLNRNNEEDIRFNLFKSRDEQHRKYLETHISFHELAHCQKKFISKEWGDLVVSGKPHDILTTEVGADMFAVAMMMKNGYSKETVRKETVLHRWDAIAIGALSHHTLPYINFDKLEALSVKPVQEIYLQTQEMAFTRLSTEDQITEMKDWMIQSAQIKYNYNQQMSDLDKKLVKLEISNQKNKLSICKLNDVDFTNMMSGIDLKFEFNNQLVKGFNNDLKSGECKF